MLARRAASTPRDGPTALAPPSIIPLLSHPRRRTTTTTKGMSAATVVSPDHASLAVAVSAALPLLIVPLVQRWAKPRRCDACLGATTRTCAACAGRGKTGFVLPGVLETDDEAGEPAAASPALVAKGRRRASLPRCDACEGRGRVPCASCNRTGLANAWLWNVVDSDDEGAWGARGQ